MNYEEKILLPGLGKQLQFLFDNYNLKDKSCLVIGSASEHIAEKMALVTGKNVQLIVSDFDSLMTSNTIIDNNENVTAKMMDFDRTDFADSQFDVVYAQGSVSSVNRNKIIKEIKRVLKQDGIFCAGEIVIQSESIPQFVKDIFDNSEMDPLTSQKFSNYYSEKGFKILHVKNLNNTLKDYYSINLKKLDSTKNSLSENEKTYFKKVINKISHEAGAFLKLGADKYIGFRAIICQRSGN